MDFWVVRELILAFALAMTIVLTFALYKNRYYSEIDEDTLLALERVHAQRHIQRMASHKRKQKGYWATRKPNWWQKRSAHWLFFYMMIFICGLLLLLLLVNPLMIGDTTASSSANITQASNLKLVMICVL